MKQLFQIGLLLSSLCVFLTSCNGQTQSSVPKEEELSNDFDEVMPFAYKMPSNLSSTDTSPGWTQNGQKISLTGTVYERDGKTPASNVIIYYYHTDIHGIYATNPNEPLNMPKNKLGQTHGYIRGWVKTGVDGKYTINTVMPGTYPSRAEPAHVHITVKEKNMEEPYYLDDFVFDDDPLLTSQRRNKLENRGGSGVIRIVKKGNLWIGERNLILGLNIPNYPVQPDKHHNSGKDIGEDLSSFTPYHAYGPDKGRMTCPICKYGWYHGILYFVGNNPNWPDIEKWLVFLDNEGQKRGKYLKAHFVYGNETDYSKEKRLKNLEHLGDKLHLTNIALTFVPSFSDKSSEIYLNKVNPNIENTIIVYRRSNIIGKFTNLKPTKENFAKIQRQLDQTDNEYFRLPGAKKE
ncbi:MAG: intradiol ring-cleavage dioxygenase [Cyclobacteriaceae bacterium]|nr:intradiol ring-cleavage dioxygenase [Cyclobacteriaceae bacterium]